MILRCTVALALCFSLSIQARELPEFAGLVERQAPVVVNISATRQAASVKAPALRSDTPGRMPEWLRRWLPPPSEPEESEEDDQAVGSGFVIDSAGYILTNAHVVEEASEILVRMNDRREYPARVVGTDRRTDIALLKVDASRLPQARLGDPSRLRVGDWVLAIGSPFGFDSSVTAGIVSAKGRSLPDDSIVPFIQTDVAINPGNSGGPLFNLKGEVVGINSQIYSRTGGFMGVSFAIPIDVAMDVQAQLRERGHVQRGRIGVLVQELSQDIASSFGLRTATGALVSQVEPDGPAAQAGLRSGDVILRCDGREVQNSHELPRIVGAVRPGRTVELEFWRDNRMRRVQLVVGAFPEEKQDTPPRIVEPAPRGSNPLGLVLQDLSRSQKRELALEQGASIVEANGAAARAELRPGDVVLAVTTGGQQQSLKSADHFNRLLQGLPRGSALTLLVLRGESRSYVGMKLPAR
ncbi:MULTISPECIES: Do family serine endopeptidase [unclassified Uliginosibacterium]|uniref:Do family serine endopeptidase n=1 Tax=unclassified Uliginosibacterium TaxID=2621521 RepID=UPI000C7B1042|nr:MULTISPECIES: Do family serine endopeptidase [unclassified Uliginosibacterium]MDO6388260.1 Do family serine endopeptidase [Uliginosibacterium sp. 31-12]PLK47346.1 protease Do [Uliginosibacterium sp. TH139]